MKVDRNDPDIPGFEQIYRIAFKAAKFSELHKGPFPGARDAEDLGSDTVSITWLALQSSEALVRAVNGEREPLSRVETRYWVDKILRQFDDIDDIDVREAVICADWATTLIDKAFLISNRETTLYRALGAFVAGTVGRLIYRYRTRPKVEDGTTYDGKRRRRLLKADEPLGDTAGAVASRDSKSSVDAVLDIRAVFAQLSELQRAICLAYFIDEETLQQLSSRPWPGHESPSLHLIRKTRNEAVAHIERVLGAQYKHITIHRG